jgi:hypothetical protein
MLKNVLVTSLRWLPGGVTDAPLDGFEVGYVTEDRVEHRIPLVDAWSVLFEAAAPVRSFPSYKGQRHFPGLWWCATTGGHIGFESWLERDHVMLLDHDQSVVGLASQPFWLFWRTLEGKARSPGPEAPPAPDTRAGTGAAPATSGRTWRPPYGASGPATRAS